MSLEAFKKLPEVQEHFPRIAGALDHYLVTMLITTAAELKGGDNAQAECGSLKTMARLIKDFRTVTPADKAGEAAPIMPGLTPLRRHQPKKPAEPKTETPK